MFGLSFLIGNPPLQIICEIDFKQKKRDEKELTKADCEIELNESGKLWGWHQEKVTMKSV